MKNIEFKGETYRVLEKFNHFVYQIYVIKKDKNTGKWVPACKNNGLNECQYMNAFSPQLHVFEGNLWCCWKEFDGNFEQVHAAVWLSGEWKLCGVKTKNNGDTIFDPHFDKDNTGNLCVAWTQRINGNDEFVKSKLGNSNI